MVCMAMLIPICFSCKKENTSELNFEFHASQIVYYPEKHISITFNIEPAGDNGPFSLKWFEPDTLKEVGPYSIDISDDLILDFEILDAKHTSARFTYEIKIGTIDSLQYDYRNRYIGKYSCNAANSYNGSTEYYPDTLTVVKNDVFNMINILTRNDLLYNYEGNNMTYLNSNGYYSYPSGLYYGYHSGASFTHDSIHYSVSGPLGYYYTIVYEGIRINN